MFTCVWGGGAVVVMVVWGGGRPLHPLAPHPQSPPMGQTIPPPPRINNPPRKGLRTLCALPGDANPLRDHTQVRRVLGGGGRWRQQVSGGGVRRPSGINVEAFLPRPQRFHLRLPTPTTPAPISIQVSPCKPKLSGMRIQIAELPELWKSEEGHSKIEKEFDTIFLQILSMNIVKNKSKNNSHVRCLLNFQSKKGPEWS